VRGDELLPRGGTFVVGEQPRPGGEDPPSVADAHLRMDAQVA